MQLASRIDPPLILLAGLTMEIAVSLDPGRSLSLLSSRRWNALDQFQVEPRRQGLELGVNGGRDGAGEGGVVVDRAHSQRRALSIGRGVQFADELIVVEDRQREVAPPSLALRLVHLEDVVEVEQVDGPAAVVDRRSNGDNRAVRPSKGLASASGSTRQVPRTPSTVAGSPASPTTFGSTGTAVPFSRAMPSARRRRSLPDPLRLVGRDDGCAGRVHPLGQVPDALPSDTTRDGDLATHHEELEHLGDVAVVGPSRRRPRHHAGVRNIARQERPGRAEPVENVASKPVVGRATPARSCLGHVAMSAR